MSVRVYLIVDGHGDCRLTKRRPTLDWDEVAFPINVAVPQGWGRVYDEYALTLDIPPPPDVEAPSVDEPIADDASWPGPSALRRGDRQL
jgi:hypothetical protein